MNHTEMHSCNTFITFVVSVFGDKFGDECFLGFSSGVLDGKTIEADVTKGILLTFNDFIHDFVSSKRFRKWITMFNDDKFVSLK